MSASLPTREWVRANTCALLPCSYSQPYLCILQVQERTRLSHTSVWDCKPDNTQGEPHQVEGAGSEGACPGRPRVSPWGGCLEVPWALRASAPRRGQEAGSGQGPEGCGVPASQGAPRKRSPPRSEVTVGWAPGSSLASPPLHVGSQLDTPRSLMCHRPTPSVRTADPQTSRVRGSTLNKKLLWSSEHCTWIKFEICP